MKLVKRVIKSSRVIGIGRVWKGRYPDRIGIALPVSVQKAMIDGLKLTGDEWLCYYLEKDASGEDMLVIVKRRKSPESMTRAELVAGTKQLEGYRPMKNNTCDMEKLE